MVVEDMADDRFRRGNSVLVPGHLCALLENGLEEDVLVLQFCFAIGTDLGIDFSPHVGDDDNVLECVVTAELSEHTEVLPRQPSHPEVGDPVEVEDPGKPATPFVSVCGRFFVRTRRSTFPGDRA